jgi:hypothetical protein
MGGVLFGQWQPIRPVAWAQVSGGQDVEEAGGTAAGDADGPADAEADELEEPGSLESARQTLRTFIKAMQKKDYRTAVTALDFSAMDPVPDPYTQVTYAQRLKASIDRLALVDASEISDDPDGPPVPFPPDKVDSDIVVRRGDDGKWRFAADTVAKIDAIYGVLKDLPPIGAEVTPAGKPTSDEDEKEASSQEPSDPDGKADEEAAPTPAVPDGLKSARRTMRTLFDSVENKDGRSAVAALDFREAEAKDPEMDPFKKQDYAFRLKEVIERMAQVDYAKISDDPEGPTCRFPPDRAEQPIEIARDETGVWRFSVDTVARIDALYAFYKDKPILNLAEEQKPWYDRELVLGNETWRILALFGALFVSLFVGQLLRTMLRWRAQVLERGGHTLRAVAQRTLSKAAVGVFFLIGLSAGMAGLVLEHDVEKFVSTMIRVVFALVIGYICFRLVDVAVEMLRQLAKRTGSTLNNMLVPIVSTSLRLTIIVVVVLDIATAISDQPPSAVLAGLGAGGLAIGLAAQDTI